MYPMGYEISCRDDSGNRTDSGEPVASLGHVVRARRARCHGPFALGMWG